MHQSCGGQGAGPPPTEDPPPEEEPPFEEPPVTGEKPGQEGQQRQFPALQNERQKIQQLLGQAEESVRQMQSKHNHDNELLRNISYVWIDGVRFENPCIQEIYDRYAPQVAVLRKQIAELEVQGGACAQSAANARRGASPPLRVLLSKSNIWVNVVQGFGPWSNLTGDCLFPIFPGGAPDDIQGLNVDRFSAAIIRSMQQGSSWDAAVAAALADPKNNSYGQIASPNSFIYAALKVWAQCLRRLYEAKFALALKQYFAELSDPGRASMIAILLDCDRDFTPAQRMELAALLDLLMKAAAKEDLLLAQVAALENQINTVLLRQFQAEEKKCQEESAARIRVFQNIALILKAALVEAATPGVPGSTPSYPVVGPDAGRAAFCEALRQLLGFPSVQNCPGLKAYVMSLIEGTCGPPR
ncbi:MAG: hypothetical protein EXS36_11550 [Pedosphaera sp.]|nr:hypothetical protein [Pedosphaera sp.]